MKVFSLILGMAQARVANARQRGGYDNEGPISSYARNRSIYSTEVKLTISNALRRAMEVEDNVVVYPQKGIDQLEVKPKWNQ